MKPENIDKLLRFVGEVAGAQPMQPKSYEAEKLLLAIGQVKWIHSCANCGERPTVFVVTEEQYLCDPCMRGDNEENEGDDV